MQPITSRVIATCFALTSFAAALVVGWMAQNPLQTILLRALFTMILCYAIGLVIGLILQGIVQKQIEQHKQQFPVPGEEMDLTEMGNRVKPAEGSQASVA